MCKISFEYEVILTYDNIFAYVEYWRMVNYVIDDNSINTRHFNAVLFVKILATSIADEEVARVGPVVSGQKL